MTPYGSRAMSACQMADIVWQTLLTICRILNPRFLSKTTSYDVASDTEQALGEGISHLQVERVGLQRGRSALQAREQVSSSVRQQQHVLSRQRR